MARDRLHVGDRQVGAGQDDAARPWSASGRPRGSKWASPAGCPPDPSVPPRAGRTAIWVTHGSRIVGYPAARASTHPRALGRHARVHRQDRHPVPDVAVRCRRVRGRVPGDGDRVGDDPAAVRADPAVRRLPRVRPDGVEPITGARGTSGSSVIVATIGNTVGLADRLRDRRVGRPAVPRALRQVPAHPPARDRARGAVLRGTARATAFFSRLLPIVRTFISFPAGVARMALGKFVALLDGRRVPLVDPARLRRARCWAPAGRTSATRSSRSTWRSRSRWSSRAVAFIWWRLGMPGRRRPSTP